MTLTPRKKLLILRFVLPPLGMAVIFALALKTYPELMILIFPWALVLIQIAQNVRCPKCNVRVLSVLKHSFEPSVLKKLLMAPKTCPRCGQLLS